VSRVPLLRWSSVRYVLGTRPHTARRGAELRGVVIARLGRDHRIERREDGSFWFVLPGSEERPCSSAIVLSAYTKYGYEPTRAGLPIVEALADAFLQRRHGEKA